MNKLRVTSSEGTSYSGDLLAIIDILKNMTEIFRRSYYSPSSADMRVSAAQNLTQRKTVRDIMEILLHYMKPYCALVGLQNFVQSVSNLLMEENRERWEEAQLVSAASYILLNILYIAGINTI